MKEQKFNERAKITCLSDSCKIMLRNVGLEKIRK